MINEVQVHIDKIAEFRRRYQNLLRNYCKNKKKNSSINSEMANIRDVCERYILRHNLNEYLDYGGVTSQVQAEYNDFSSASDFHEILENLITQLKSK